LGVAFFGDFSAMLPQAQDQIIERFTRFRRYFNPRKTLVGTLLSDFNLRDLEIRTSGQNLIEHLRQNQGIDDVSAQFDCFGKHRRNLPERNPRASHQFPRRDRNTGFASLCAQRTSCPLFLISGFKNPLAAQIANLCSDVATRAYNSPEWKNRTCAAPPRLAKRISRCGKN
jgi:hypothetical protein